MNGTTLEVPAGYTSFKAVAWPYHSKRLLTYQPRARENPNDKAVAPEDVDAFTLEVTFQHGRALEQGMKIFG
jgi:hypothetical protein